jgi:disulfide bond formation protein DsbB
MDNHRSKIFNPSIYLYIAWLASVASFAGSLYFSNVVGFAPCDLCWWQRVFMYPIAVVLFVGLWRKDRCVPYYTIPLAFIGGLIALYHNLIYEGMMPEVIKTCTTGVSCTTKYVEIFGFISIPMLSLLSFVVIIVASTIYLNKQIRSR